MIASQKCPMATMAAIQIYQALLAACPALEDEQDSQLVGVGLFFFQMLSSWTLFIFSFLLSIKASGPNAQNGSHSLGGERHLHLGGFGKTFTTDTEEDETVDFLLKSAMTVPKGQPPKKRTKKYGERKSCKLSFFY